MGTILKSSFGFQHEAHQIAEVPGLCGTHPSPPITRSSAIEFDSVSALLAGLQRGCYTTFASTEGIVRNRSLDALVDPFDDLLRMAIN